MEQKNLTGIFYPTMAEKHKAAASSDLRFAYYTTAATASIIISKQQIWLRSTGVMNDHGEVIHGARCVFNYLEDEKSKNFKVAIDSCHPGASTEIVKLVQDWFPVLLGDTFICCISEHSADDDEYGRLSMWRAYGGESGTAIIFKKQPFLSGEIHVGAYTYPVIYGDDYRIITELTKIGDNIAANRTQLAKMQKGQFMSILFDSLRALAIATKHKAFEEEKEWRIVASPQLLQNKFLNQEIHSIGSVTQVIYNLKVGEAAKSGIKELEMNNLIDKLMIGPTEYSEVLRRSLTEQLKLAGVEDAHRKVHVTNIPLRPNQR